MLEQSFRNIDINKKALDAAWLRNDALSNNLANINTPGYKREDVDFDEILKNYLQNSSVDLLKTNSKHININGDTLESLEPRIDRETNISYRKDGNSVNIDTEMAELAKNQIKFNAITGQLNSQISRIKLAIRDGR